MTIRAANDVTPPTDWGWTVRADFLDLILGELLGGGIGRHVYALKVNPELVVKVESRAKSFQNITEAQIWEEVRGTKWEKWFAPVEEISICGSVLLQRRTRPIETLPARLPDIFTDLKPENFGTLGGRVVCHDYGYTRLPFLGLGVARMRRVPS